MPLFNQPPDQNWSKFKLGSSGLDDLENFTSTSQIPSALSSALRFSYPATDWKNEEHLRLIFPPGAKERGVIARGIQANLIKVASKEHRLCDLMELSHIVSGTTVIASSGFVRDPRELLDYAAKRYAAMVIIDIDKYMLRRLLSGTSSYRFTDSGLELSIQSSAPPGSIASLKIGDTLMEGLSKKTFWTNVRTLNTDALEKTLLSVVRALVTVEDEAKAGFSEMLDLYRDLSEGGSSGLGTK